ncbi:hypothetical protein [Azonexus sp. IMCC34839]|uniref:hypothetical protein n=1 Tax=Azonexus sp. IMCC34839 TaxID=3133695 RepID=UPI00399B861B
MSDAAHVELLFSQVSTIEEAHRHSDQCIVAEIEAPSDIDFSHSDSVLRLEVLNALRGPPGIPGGGVRIVTTPPTEIVDGKLQLPFKAIGDVIWNMALIYCDLEPGDLLEDGRLSGDKEYVVEEQNNVFVSDDGMYAVFMDIDVARRGLFAVVSYAAEQN